MKVRKTLLVAAGWAGLAGTAVAQIPVAAPAPAPPVPVPLGTPVATTPTTTIWAKLGISKDQKAACRAALCATPFGQLISNAKAPLSIMTGGLVPPFCPITTPAQLADPGAQGAAAAIKADEAGAAARRAAVRYLGTVDCHYWPEAGDALIASLRGDRNECVRWEAAMALGSGCCCNKKTIEALTIVVSCSDRDGAPKETSWRVHAAAAAALDHCLSCYASVPAVAPVTEGEKPIERTPPPVEGGPVPPPPPPPPPPVPPPATDTSAAKPFAPGEAKPAPSQMAAAKPAAQRPVGPAYYAHIAKAPLAAILAEARRVAAEHHGTPMVSDTPFQAQGHTVASLITYTVGPNTQSIAPPGEAILPAHATAPSTGETATAAAEVRTETVAVKRNNLWDLLTKPSEEKVVVKQPSPTPVTVRQEPVVAKPEPKKADLALTPIAPPLPQTPLPPPPSAPRPEPLTLDFPPPAAEIPLPPPPREVPPAEMPKQGPSAYYATAATRATGQPKEPVTSPASSYFATAATPITGQPKPPVTSPVSSYYATAASPAAPVSPWVTTEDKMPATSGYHATAVAVQPQANRSGEQVGGAAESSYHATAIAVQSPAYRPSQSAGAEGSSYHATAMATQPTVKPPSDPNASGISSYYATAATLPTPASPQVKTEDRMPAVSGYHATAVWAQPPVKGAGDPTASAGSGYHATAMTPPAPMPPTKPAPAASSYNASATAPTKPTPPPVAKAPNEFPAPSVTPATPLPTRPMPPPPAPVVPAVATSPTVNHLLETANGDGPVEVRKTCIQQLASLKANTPDVMTALEKLSDDPEPAVRAEAIIAAARLRLNK